MSLSKVFIEKVTKKNLLCSDIYHPGESCSQFNLYLIKKTWIHCAKFYAPIVLLPLVKKINSVQWIEVKKSLIFYIHMILGSYIPSILTIGSTCLFSKYLGRIYLPTFIYIPNFIVTMLYTPFMDQRVANIYANIMLMVNLEALIREGRSYFWQILRDSKLMQTILFMMSSSIVLDTMSSMPTNIFWFINPHVVEDVTVSNQLIKSPIIDTVLPTTSNNCKHKYSCDQHIWRGAKQISMTMIGFEAFRVMFTNIKTIYINPSRTPNILKNKINFPLISMVSGYTLIFKITQCIQNRLKISSYYSNLISGFLCGSVFWINADWSLLCHGLSAAIQLTFQNYFMRWLALKNKFIANYAAKFPWSKVFYTLTIGYALHLIVLYPSLCSNFMHKISDMVLSYRFRQIRKHTLEALQTFSSA